MPNAALSSIISRRLSKTNGKKFAEILFKEDHIRSAYLWNLRQIHKALQALTERQLEQDCKQILTSFLEGSP